MIGGRTVPLVGALRDPLVPAVLVTLFVSLIRAPDQPSVALSIGSSQASVDPSDVAIVVLGVWLAARLIRRRDLQRWKLPPLLTGGVFCVLILVSGATNGLSALVAGGKFVELAVLAVGVAYIVDSSERLWLLLLALLLMNAAADVSALKGFLVNGERQRSFLGSHDLAALGTMSITVWYSQLFSSSSRQRRIGIAAGVAGAVAILLGAALASLIGVYLAAAGVAYVARRRGEFRPKAALVMIATLLALTGGVLELRSDNLSFLRVWFGVKQHNQPLGAEHGSWSQRLIFVYIGGRVFLANPVFGTGWYPDLPPQEYKRFLPAAHRRYPLQPAVLFPPANGTFIPQMAYDQVLYELGLTGAVVLLLFLAAMVRASLASGRRRPRDELDPLFAYTPLAWTGSMVGALAGIGLFGGATISTLLWVTVGAVAALTPSPSQPEA